MERLRSDLEAIDGKGYKAYKSLKGSYSFTDYTLDIDHVQGDPFAAPTRISIRIESEVAGFPEDLSSSPIRRIALEDFISRAIAVAIELKVKGSRGIGKSGEVCIETSGQQVLVRNSLLVRPDYIEARLIIGLPSSGRTILSREAEAMFFRELPEVVSLGMIYENLNGEDVKRHVHTVEDQEFLRSQLCEKGLVAFIGDGSLLPRRSGIDDRPLEKKAVPFVSPESMAQTIDLPNRGKIRGMAIPHGVTLIVGGGFHGKSTLLHALEGGIYNHIPDDGREQVVTDPSAVKIRAEDGRIISCVNISPFIDNLPFGRDTIRFSTENASGSTSQAANIIEALDYGAQALLIDEDTSATNFMIRDGRMQALVAKEKEPITPLLMRVHELYEQKGISSIIVMGGSGDYFGVSDRVIMMDAYRPMDVTEDAHRLAAPVEGEQATLLLPFKILNKTRPDKDLLSPARGHRDVKIDARDCRSILYGTHEIDLSRVEQLVDAGQTRAIGLLIYYYATHFFEASTTLMDGLRLTFDAMEEGGLDILPPYKSGDLSLPRLYEVAAAINRIRVNV